MKEKPLTPREFLSRYQLPQLVRIHEAHLQQVNESRPKQVNRLRFTKNENDRSIELNQVSKQNDFKLESISSNNLNQESFRNSKVTKQSTIKNKKINQKSIKKFFNSKANNDENKVTDKKIKNNENIINSNEEIDYQNQIFKTNTLASSDSGNASAASSNYSENQYTSKNQFVNKIDNGGYKLNSKDSIDKKLIDNNDNLLKQINPEKKLLDLDQPFLLYKSYSSRQVIAHTLDVSSAAKVSLFQRTGPALLIPETYSGWFSLVTSTGQTAGYFKSIEELAIAQVPFFMSRDGLWTLPVTNESNELDLIDKGQLIENHINLINNPKKLNNGIESSNKIYLPAGTSFQLLGLYEDVSSLVNKKNRTIISNNKCQINLSDTGDAIRKKFLMGNGEQRGPRYLKCLALAGDQFFKNKMVFIPTTQVGRFYVICKKKVEKFTKQHVQELSYNHVYKLSQLIKLIELPATVQLVIGQRPREYNNQLCLGKDNKVKEWDFTAVLKLEQFKIRDVILSCTVRSQPFKLDQTGKTKQNSNFLQKNKENFKTFSTNDLNIYQKQEKLSLVPSMKKTLLSQSIRNKKKKSSNFLFENEKNENTNLLENDGSFSTQTGDLAILLEFDLDSNFKFLPVYEDDEEINNYLKKKNLSLNKKPSSLFSLKIYSSLKKSKHDNFNLQISDNDNPLKVLSQRIFFCDLHSDNWRKQIKIAHDIVPKPPPINFVKTCDSKKKLNCNLKNTDCILKNSTSKNHNNNNSQFLCCCEKCQVKLFSEFNEGNVKMPSMDNIMLNINDNKQLNKFSLDQDDKKIIANGKKHIAGKKNEKSLNKTVNGSINTIKKFLTQFNTSSKDDNLIINDNKNNFSTNKRMLSYSTKNLNSFDDNLGNNDLLKNVCLINKDLNKSEIMLNCDDNLKNHSNCMLSLLSKFDDTKECLENCCEVQNICKIPKIKLKRDLNIMQASFSNNTSKNLLSQKTFSKSSDSLANLHLYETLEKSKKPFNQHISRKHTLDVLFSESKDDTNYCDNNHKTVLEIGNNNIKQFTTKIILKKQSKIRQKKPAKIVNDLPNKKCFYFEDQNNFLIKKNSFSSNYESDSEG